MNWDRPSFLIAAGGISWNALRYGAFLKGTESSGSDLVYEETGLGLFGGFIADSHFR